MKFTGVLATLVAVVGVSAAAPAPASGAVTEERAVSAWCVKDKRAEHPVVVRCPAARDAALETEKREVAAWCVKDKRAEHPVVVRCPSAGPAPETER